MVMSIDIHQSQPQHLPALRRLFLRAVLETASGDYSPAQVRAWTQVDEAAWRECFASYRCHIAW